MDSLRTFVYKLALALGLPWFALIVIPYVKQRHLQPVPYLEVDGEANSDVKGYVYPSMPPGWKMRGQEVYSKEGCAQCHTQVIRPTYAGWDQWKKGWGANQDSKLSIPARQTTQWDYLYEDFAMIGLRRVGPDLANAGYRFKTANEVHAKLYAPRAQHAWSVMPSFAHLYELKKIEAAPRADAVKFLKDSNVSVPEGWQVVPTNEARALAEYVLSLKRDTPLPNSIAPLAKEDKK